MCSNCCKCFNCMYAFDDDFCIDCEHYKPDQADLDILKGIISIVGTTKIVLDCGRNFIFSKPDGSYE